MVVLFGTVDAVDFLPLLLISVIHGILHGMGCPFVLLEPFARSPQVGARTQGIGPSRIQNKAVAKCGDADVPAELGSFPTRNVLGRARARLRHNTRFVAKFAPSRGLFQRAIVLLSMKKKKKHIYTHKRGEKQ